MKRYETQDIIDMYQSGDLAGMVEAQKTLSKRANSRLLDIEKQGLQNSPAYKRVDYYTQGEKVRFSAASKNKSFLEIYENLLNINKFLNSSTGSVGRYKAYKQDIANELKDSGVFDESIDNDKIIEFLESDAWENLKKYVYTTNTMTDISDALTAGAKVSDLEKAYHDFVNGDTDSDPITIFEEWVESSEEYSY
jgi:hypothetical protein